MTLQWEADLMSSARNPLWYIHFWLKGIAIHYLHTKTTTKSISLVQILTEPLNVDRRRKYLYLLNKEKEEEVGDVYKCYQCHTFVDFVLVILNFTTHSPKNPQLLSIPTPHTLYPLPYPIPTRFLVLSYNGNIYYYQWFSDAEFLFTHGRFILQGYKHDRLILLGYSRQIHTSELQTWHEYFWVTHGRFILQGYKHDRLILLGYSWQIHTSVTNMMGSYFRVANMADSYFRVTNMRQIHTSGLQTWDRFILQGYKHGRFILQGYKHGRFILLGYKHETDSYSRVRNITDSYLRVTNMKQIHTSGLKARHIYSYFRVTNRRQIHTPGFQSWLIHTSGLQTWSRFILQG